MNHRSLRSVPALLLLAAVARAQEPAAYYASVDPTNAATLRTTLHNVIKNHTKIPYTASATDTWDVLAAASEDPANAANILEVYKNDSIAKQTGGNTFYDREHTWPNSYGFPNDGADNYPYTDCHMLFLSRQAYNSSRGNAPYGSCPGGCSEFVTTLTNGQGGGAGVYPGNSNWSSGSTTSDVWETWVGKRGDVARAILYADVRYEGGTHGITGQPEPDLRVTDTLSLISNSATGSNLSIAYMGMKSVLVAWSNQDPPDAWERRRNDVVMTYQGNRNPFIDHPEWVNCLFGAACPSGVAFCYGDGSGAACPCSNASPYGANAGCLNGLGVAGQLVANGVPSIASDTLVLQGSNMPNSFVLYFQGTSPQSANAGLAFGDGKLCVAGTIVRLGITLNSGGASQFPASGGIAISVGGGDVAGNVRHYQGWYRDAAAFCTSATYNLTNGYRVVWTP